MLDGPVLLLGALSPLVLAVVFWRGAAQAGDPVLRDACLVRDALNLWLGGTLARSGEIAAVFDPAAYWAAGKAIFGAEFGLHTWSYPPPTLLLAVPLSLLPVIPAFLAWNALGAAALWRGARSLGLSSAASLVAAASPAAMESILAGQNGLICAALVLPGLALLQRKPWLAGALLGALVIKPQMAALVPVCLLASRNWRAMLATALSAASLALASALAFGWASWTGFTDAVLPFMRHDILEAPWLAGTYQPMMVTPFMAARWAGASLRVAYGVQALSAVGSVLLCWRAWRNPSSDDLPRVALTLALTFCVTPYGYCYDQPALTAALLALAVRDGRWCGGMRLLFAVAWVVPGLGTWFGVLGLPPLGLAAVAAAAALAAPRSQGHRAGVAWVIEAARQPGGRARISPSEGEALVPRAPSRPGSSLR